MFRITKKEVCKKNQIINFTQKSFEAPKKIGFRKLKYFEKKTSKWIKSSENVQNCEKNRFPKMLWTLKFETFWT